jgi:hypothetical protein
MFTKMLLEQFDSNSLVLVLPVDSDSLVLDLFVDSNSLILELLVDSDSLILELLVVLVIFLSRWASLSLCALMTSYYGQHKSPLPSSSDPSV